MTYEIPVSNELRQNFNCTINGITVVFDVWWQPSDRHWYATIRTGEGIIARSVRLLPQSWPLDGLVHDVPGDLYVAGAEPTDTDAWGTTHHLLWVS